MSKIINGISTWATFKNPENYLIKIQSTGKKKKK